METPEDLMKLGFESLYKAQDSFRKTIPLYKQRNNALKGDKVNIQNIEEALDFLSAAYDAISDIWENNIQTNK